MAIAFSSAPEREYISWKEAAQRESDLYAIDPAYVASSMEGKERSETPFRRTWLDGLLVVTATLIFVAFGAMAVIPNLELNWIWLAALTSAMLVVLVACGLQLRRITGFS